MFESMLDRNYFSYAFEKIRNAISSPGENNLYAATRLGLDVLSQKYNQFRQELRDAGVSGDHEYDLDTLEHAIGVLLRWFEGNPDNLTERDARIYSRYLEKEHQGFEALARELATGHVKG
ncbi:hypothetical protein TH60_21300 [Pantoea ananatis]|jgi:hypothetical protein|uniref:hypothetical protein n=1 Tax=Pantoea ananas TaxID=553 RepID=UPI00234FE930|nr:hypothetical protein [Pantoea ananatis]MDC7872031.1 hypothetical protein [Pantoea ananatis]